MTLVIPDRVFVEDRDSSKLVLLEHKEIRYNRPIGSLEGVLRVRDSRISGFFTKDLNHEERICDVGGSFINSDKNTIMLVAPEIRNEDIVTFYRLIRQGPYKEEGESSEVGELWKGTYATKRGPEYFSQGSASLLVLS